jgi:cell wall-associated NlpC family hydrolase
LKGIIILPHLRASGPMDASSLFACSSPEQALRDAGSGVRPHRLRSFIATACVLGLVASALPPSVALAKKPATAASKKIKSRRGASRVAAGHVKVETAYLRQGPNTQHKVSALLDAGRTARVVERKNGWLRVRLGTGTEGWLRADLMKVSRRAVPAAKPAAPKIAAAKKPIPLTAAQKRKLALAKAAMVEKAAKAAKIAKAQKAAKIAKFAKIAEANKAAKAQKMAAAAKAAHAKRLALLAAKNAKKARVAAAVRPAPPLVAQRQRFLRASSFRAPLIVPTRVAAAALPQHGVIPTAARASAPAPTPARFVPPAAPPRVSLAQASEARVYATPIATQPPAAANPMISGDEARPGDDVQLADSVPASAAADMVRAVEPSGEAFAAPPAGSDTGTQRLQVAQATSGVAPLVRVAPRVPTRGEHVVRTALTYRGTPYRRGATGRGAFDCSGFTLFLYRKAGSPLPRTAAQQFRRGRPVPKSQMKPGDLVFFCNTYKRGISHVGVYVGENRFVHAAGRGRGVRVDSLDRPFYRRKWAGARRPA